jgi:hypothetical protein
LERGPKKPIKYLPKSKSGTQGVPLNVLGNVRINSMVLWNLKRNSQASEKVS